MEEKKNVKLQLNEFEMELILGALDFFRISVYERIQEMLEEKKKEDIDTYIAGLEVAEDLQALIEKMGSARKLMESENNRLLSYRQYGAEPESNVSPAPALVNKGEKRRKK